MADQTDLLMITTNVILRTFWIRKGDSAGTGFTLDYDQKQYLVTSRHVVDGIARSDAVDVFHNGNWKNLPVIVVGNGEDDIDICVMAAATRLSPPLTLEPSAAGMIYGQEAYFLGFPYGLSGDTDPLTNGFPLPFSLVCVCGLKVAFFLPGWAQ